MDLRNYQIPADLACTEFFSSKKKTRPSIVVCPTGWGKSYLVASQADKAKEGTVVLQPTVELLNQNYEKYLLTGKQASIYSASKGVKEIGHVTFATLGSIKKAAGDLAARGFKHLIIDEVHLYSRSAEGMLQKFIAAVGFTKVLGLTATPLQLQTNSDYYTGQNYSQLKMLTDVSKKGNLFKDIIHVSQIEEVVREGFWTNMIYHTSPFSADKLEYNTTKADYTEVSLGNAYEDNEIEFKICQQISHYSDRKSILVAVPSVAHAKALASIIPGARAVWGDMDLEERREVIRDFKALKIRVVVQVNVLSVGFDHPLLDTIICGRPTASLAWYYQLLGRGVRPHSDKLNCLVIDLVGNFDKFGRIEELTFRKEKRETSNRTQWRLFGEGGKLLTGIPMHEIGQHFGSGKAAPKDDPLLLPKGEYEGKSIMDVPIEYLQWMIKYFNFTESTMHFKPIIKKRIEDEQTQKVSEN